MKKVCEKAWIKPFRFHAIRHHVTSILADSGKASTTQVQKFLCHRRSTTTNNYIKMLNPELKQIAKLLYKQTYTEDKKKGVR
jgi:site-specific recombinase XerD